MRVAKYPSMRMGLSARDRAAVTRGRVAAAGALLLVALAAAAPAGAAPGLRDFPGGPATSPDDLRPRRSFSITSDPLAAALLPFALPPGSDSIAYDLHEGRIKRTLSYGGVPLLRPLVYTEDEWRAAVVARAFAESRRKSATEAVARSSRGPTGALTKFEIPVKFPKAIGGIIGQGVDINVSGREAISFSGESNFPIKPRENEIGGPRRFPDLDMRQQLQINLDGTIGDKIHVLVQHDSETQTPLANRIRLRYDGTEDEVIQKVEIGNTQLTLPGNNQYVSFSGRQQGLFGAKLEGKAGNLDFTTIVSKQEGRTDRESFVGQSSERTVTIPDKDYVQNRVFWVSRDPLLDGPVTTRVESLEVFLDDKTGSNDLETGAFPGVAYLDADPSQDGEPPGNFHQLQEAIDYSIYRELGILVVNRAVLDNEVLAVRYKTVVGPGDTLEVGTRPSPATEANPAILKLIKPVNPDPNLEGTEVPRLRVTWRYQLRNVYDLHATGVQQEGFSLRILKRIPGQEDTDVQNGTPFLRVLGLDNEGTQPGTPPDDRVDVYYADCNTRLPWRELLLVNYDAGLVFFPGEQPFDPFMGQEDLDCGADPLVLEDRNPGIYNKRYSRVTSTDQKYVIEVRYRAAGSSTLSLGRSNILEGSEVVRLGDKTLVRGIDYRITYEIGLIEFLSDEAKRPDARITVDFEYAPFLAQQQKSLLGAAGTYRFSPTADLSSIWLFESNKTPYRRPRLGQEPSRALVGGFSGSWRFSPSGVTRLVDKLPLVETERPSNLSLSGETAMSFPNPNTRDNIYVDDMEGTEETSSLGVGRRQWTFPSLPLVPGTGTLVVPSDRFRRVEWYNPRNAAQRRDLNPELPESEGNNAITILEVALRGGTPNSASGIGGWGGVTRLLSKTGVDYSRRKFLEVWINDFNVKRGKMHVDLGTLSEDAMWERVAAPNGRLDTEDKNFDERLDETGERGPLDEDTGLDGLFDGAEPASPDRPPTPAGCQGQLDEDVAGDNYCYDDDESEHDYSYINGTEDNGFLDTEDLDGNRILDEREAYFHYTVDLDPNVDSVAAYGREGTGWRLYRIPLVDGAIAAGSPTFDRDIKSVRLWFSDLDRADAVFQIASVEVVGNRWLEGRFLSGAQERSLEVVPGYGLLADTTQSVGRFAVRVIDSKSGEDYDSPPQVEIRETNGVREREQSLVLQFDDLAGSHSTYAAKDLFQDENYSRYTKLDFLFQTRRASGGDPWLFLRFGSDSLNFYEFRTPLVEDQGWRQVFIDLETLTQVKLKESPDDSLTLYIAGRKLPYYTQAVPDGEIAAVGAPTLTRVGLVEFGIVNRAAQGSTSGEVWVNELRLTEVRKDAGFAQRISAAADFADLASINAGFSRTDDEFQSLGGARSGSTNSSLRLGGGFNAHKFFAPLNVALPLTWNWSREKALPELKTGSDAVLIDREAERTERKSLGGGVSLSRSKKSSSTLLYHSLDAMSLRLSGTKSNSFSPTKVDSSTSYGIGYQYTFRPRTPKDLRLYRSLRVAWFPTSISFSASKDETQSVSVDQRALRSEGRTKATREVRTRSSRSVLGIDAAPIAGKNFTTTYAFTSTRDHGREKDENGKSTETFIKGVNYGLEVARTQSAGAVFTPGLPKRLAWIAPNLTYDTQYTENAPFELEVADPQNPGRKERRRTVRNQNTSKLSMNIGLTSLFRARPASSDADSTRGGLGAQLRGLGLLARRLQDVRTSVSLSRNSGFDRVKGRPDWKYQLGVADAIEDAIRDRSVAGREERFDRTRNITGSMSSGMNLGQGISLTGQYSFSESRQLQSRNQQERRSSTWPDVNFSWSNLERIKAVRRLVESASVSTGYQITNEMSGTDIHHPNRESKRVEWSPLISLSATFESGLHGTLSGSRSKSTGKSLLGATTEDEATQASYRLGLDYRIKTARRVSVPLLGKGEPTTFTSELTLNLDFNYQTNRDVVKGRLNQPEVEQSNTRAWTVAPRANYSFSRNVSGSLEARYGETNNRKNENLSRRTVGVSVAATLTF